jgi:hypothetical protein
MTTDLDNTNNKKGVKQPSGVLRLDNEDVSGSLAALAEVAYVMAPQNQANGGAAAAETTRRGERAMKQEDDSAKNTTINLPVSSGLCTCQAGNTSMMLEYASESEYTPKSHPYLTFGCNFGTPLWLQMIIVHLQLQSLFDLFLPSICGYKFFINYFKTCK